jgi:hypothetical protein
MELDSVLVPGLRLPIIYATFSNLINLSFSLIIKRHVSSAYKTTDTIIGPGTGRKVAGSRPDEVNDFYQVT